MLASYLARPTRQFSDVTKLMEDTVVTKDRFGTVARVYIICDQDKILEEDTQRWIIARNPPNKVKTIAGADHMVMFSKPHELCSPLEEIAGDYTRVV